MAKKQNQMINYLLSSNDFVPISKIATDCKISQRTVYNYIDRLKEDGKYTIESTKQGVRLLTKKQKEFTMLVPEDYEERKNFIYRKGLISQKKLKIDDVMKYFQVSDSTMHSDIIKIRREISKYHVRLITKDNEMYFSGNYHDLKKMTQAIIYNESDNNHSLLSTERLIQIFPNIDVTFVKDTIQSALQKLNYFMDEYSVINLLIHILISLNQEMNGVVPLKDNNVELIDNSINEICFPIEEHFGFTFSNSSKNQFALILSTRIKKDYNSFDESNFTNKNTIELSTKIFDSLYINFNVDMRASEQMYSFMLHLDSLLTRLSSGIMVNNPLLGIIKRSSPITYDLAVSIARVIESETGFRLSESEIAYIALHIGTKIEELKSVRTRVKAIIVCPEYYMYNSRLKKIVSLYNEDIYVSNVYTSFDDIGSLEGIDLIICTILPSAPITEVRTLVVSNFLTSIDKNNISDIVVQIKKQNRIDRSRESIYSLFKEELFFANASFKDRDEAIDFLSKKLVENGYVSSGFKDAVLYREEIAPTDFNMVAIPHPAEYSANKTVISVCILNEPLLWGKNYVSIIMMIAVNGKDFTIFEDLFSALTMITTDNSKIKELLSNKTYKDFVNSLIKMLYEEECEID